MTAAVSSVDENAPLVIHADQMSVSNGGPPVEMNETTSIELQKLRWTRCIPFSSLLLFVFGMSYSFAVFSLPLEQQSSSFLAPFTSALGVQSFSIAISMLLGAYILDSYPNQLQLFLFIGLILILIPIYLIQVAVSHLNSSLLYWSTSSLGFGLGTLYIAGVEHAARWMPELVGLAMGLGMGALGLGSILGSKIFAFLLDTFTLTQSLYALLLIFGVPLIVSIPFLRFPPSSFHPSQSHNTEQSMTSSSSAPTKKLAGRKLGLALLKQPSFYLLLVIVAMGAGPGYGALVSFPSILKVSFGLTQKDASGIFAWLQVIGMLTRFLFGFCVDYLNFGHGFFWSGAKNLSMLILFVQSGALALLPWFQHTHQFHLFLGCLIILFISFSASAVLAAVLSRQIFSPANSAIVFGFAGGLTDGFATMLFSIFSASVLESSIESTPSNSPLPEQTYDIYFSTCVFFSLLGFICAICIPRCSAAFEYVNKAGNRIILVEHDEKKYASSSSLNTEIEVFDASHESEALHESFKKHSSENMALARLMLVSGEQKSDGSANEDEEEEDDDGMEYFSTSLSASYTMRGGGGSLTSTRYDTYIVQSNNTASHNP
uniref:Major facilitator superfamily (MFS) profile domain-containing protein n=1 Tax=Timspurckia oligopyrenoides TaxID=708627 RepID=A0A7S0ZB61_9RHOD